MDIASNMHWSYILIILLAPTMNLKSHDQTNLKINPLKIILLIFNKFWKEKSKETFKTSTLYSYKGISISKSEISQTYICEPIYLVFT